MNSFNSGNIFEMPKTLVFSTPEIKICSKMNEQHQTAVLKSGKPQTNISALATLVIVFFFWGFIAASNSIFIPFCKEHFNLTQFESQLIGSAFYGAYFIGSLLLFILSNIKGIDILNKIGYKRGIIYGLFLSAIGALLIIPSANANSFPALLGSYFVIALGFSLQQTAANPFAILLGDPATGSHRLNFAGGVNSLGTTLGPIIISFFLFGSVGDTTKEVTVSNVNSLYIIVASVFTAVALFFLFSKSLPDGKNEASFEKANKAARSLVIMTGIILGIILISQFTDINEFLLLLIVIIAVVGILFFSNSQAKINPHGWGAMGYPQLVLGMLAIFVYVGVEVTIDNNFGALLAVPGYFNETGLSEGEISKYVSLYWGSLMIGRWTAAVSVFNLTGIKRIITTIIVPFVAFAVILLANSANGEDVGDLYGYSIFIVIAIIAFFYGQEKPVKTLLTVSILALIFMLIGVFTNGIISVYAFMAGGLCCSVMWPGIFALSISGLGKYTSQGSAFLIMMILGGAVIPPLQGAIGDVPEIGMHYSYLFAAFCFALLIVITLAFKSILKRQGIDYDAQIESSGH